MFLHRIVLGESPFPPRREPHPLNENIKPFGVGRGLEKAEEETGKPGCREGVGNTGLAERGKGLEPRICSRHLFFFFSFFLLKCNNSTFFFFKKRVGDGPVLPLAGLRQEGVVGPLGVRTDERGEGFRTKMPGGGTLSPSLSLSLFVLFWFFVLVSSQLPRFKKKKKKRKIEIKKIQV
ncbi:hypothetical protein E2320_022200 [Naja naja]|nr:hypothetical protein E2320_022200 [Naja naja]